MKKSLISLSISLSIALLVSSCGGSSTPTDTDISDNTSTTEQATTLSNSSYIQGVYDISIGDDILYLSIEEDGLVNTYDYQNSNGNDCYIKNATDGYNTEINGKFISHDGANSQFTLENYTWEYDGSHKITKVATQGISAGSILNMNGTIIATNTQLTTSTTVEEMEANICDENINLNPTPAESTQESEAPTDSMQSKDSISILHHFPADECLANDLIKELENDFPEKKDFILSVSTNDASCSDYGHILNFNCAVDDMVNEDIRFEEFETSCIIGSDRKQLSQ